MLFTEGLKKVEWVAMGSSKDIVTNLQIDPIDSFWLLIKHGLLILPEVVKYKFGKYDCFMEYSYLIDFDNKSLGLYRLMGHRETYSFDFITLHETKPEVLLSLLSTY